jgi:predicted nucleotidyltransferase
MNEKALFERVKNQLATVDAKASVWLFGSRAREAARSDSDWDFLILTTRVVTPELKQQFYEALYTAELETDQVFNAVIRSVPEWEQLAGTPFFQNVMLDRIAV